MSVVATRRASWTRVNPAQIVSIPGKVKIMAVAAKKHVTLFVRNPPRSPPGKRSTKLAFKAAASKYTSLQDDRYLMRSNRNEAIANEIRGKTGDGYYYRRSRSKKYAGKFFKLKPGETVSNYIAQGRSPPVVDSHPDLGSAK